jgi:hypothetical protein
MERSEGDMSLKNPVTPPGIDPGTVWLVAQCLNHYAAPGPFIIGPIYILLSQSKHRQQEIILYPYPNIAYQGLLSIPIKTTHNRDYRLSQSQHHIPEIIAYSKQKSMY